MTNLEYYKDDIIALYGDNFLSLSDTVIDFVEKLDIDFSRYRKDKNLGMGAAVLTWLSEEHKQLILNPNEKRYLVSVVEPFKDDVESIEKVSCVGEEKGVFCECIYINCKNGDKAKLPTFIKGSAYQGMQANVKYTLNELGFILKKGEKGEF